MVTYGNEVIGDYKLYNKHHPGDEIRNHGGIPIVFGEKLDKMLSKHGHKRGFFNNQRDVSESHLTDVSLKGTDNYFADNVDLYFIGTHGTHDTAGNIRLFYDTKAAEWLGSSAKWKLGDKKLKWLMIGACNTLIKFNVKALWHIFHGLHLICGSYGNYWDGDGEELGENLAEYIFKTMADVWIDGIGFPYVILDNHPMVVAAEKKETIDLNVKPGDVVIDWANTTIDRDRLMFPVNDIPNSDIAWVSIKWRHNYNMRIKTSSST